jgi:hypothetical protein
MLGKPAIICGWDSTNIILKKTEVGCEHCVVGREDECAYDDVPMAVDVFR